jgi:hypothetical protein
MKERSMLEYLKLTDVRITQIKKGPMIRENGQRESNDQ